MFNSEVLLSKPTSVMILGQEFKISYVKQVPLEGCEPDDMVYGTCDGAEQRIKIQKDLKGDILVRTLLHEMIHGILHVSGQGETLKGDQEEGLVVALENGLVSLVATFPAKKSIKQ